MHSKTSSWLSNVNRNVFFSTVLIISVFLSFAIFTPGIFESLSAQAKQWITDSFSWFYIWWCFKKYAETKQVEF